MTCPNCGTTDSLTSLWETPEQTDATPHYLGCTECHQLLNPRLLRQPDEETPSQASLSDHEVERLSIGNQHSDSLSIIGWRCVKGAAIHYGVTDWTSKVDSTLTVEENVSLMERHGTKNKTSTLREMRTPRIRGEDA